MNQGWFGALSDHESSSGTTMLCDTVLVVSLQYYWYRYGKHQLGGGRVNRPALLKYAAGRVREVYGD